MKVKDLKDHLKDFPDDMEIIVSIYSEGNAYHSMSSILLGLADTSEYYIEDVLDTPKYIKECIDAGVGMFNESDIQDSMDALEDGYKEVLVIYP